MNLEEIDAELLSQNMHFAELSSGNTNQTELISLLIIQGKTFVEGIENVYRRVKGSCSMPVSYTHLRKPDYFLNAASRNAAETIANVIRKSDELMEEVRPDAVLDVYKRQLLPCTLF